MGGRITDRRKNKGPVRQTRDTGCLEKHKKVKKNLDWRRGFGDCLARMEKTKP